MIYILFRSPEYLEDVRERRLEIRAIESRLGGAETNAPSATAEIEPDFLVCPVCTTKLRYACAECRRPLEPAWQVCPYCETPVPVEPPVAPHPSSGSPSNAPPRLTAGNLPDPVAVERTLILAKPDAVERSLAGEILARFERRGLRLARRPASVHASRELGETHYAEHREKPFFGELVDFISSAPTLAFVLEGEGAIATARKTIGATNPAEADPGSLRGELALAMPNNLVHGSDSPESAGARSASGSPTASSEPPSGESAAAAVSESLVLASTSPQRRRSSPSSAIPFEVSPPDYEEAPGGDPVEHAAGKARSVDGGGRPGAWRRHRRRVRRRAAIGKPRESATPGGCSSFSPAPPTRSSPGFACAPPTWEELHARRRPSHLPALSQRDLARYLESGEWEGRAGGYAIQGLGASLVERIDGDYLNVVGLPGARCSCGLLARGFPASTVSASVASASSHAGEDDQRSGEPPRRDLAPREPPGEQRRDHDRRRAHRQHRSRGAAPEREQAEHERAEIRDRGARR